MTNSKKKVLCIGDSLALPGHLNKYEDTWFYKIKNEFPDYDFLSFFKRQLTTDVLTTMGGGKGGVDNWPKGADCLEAYCPDVVITQLGIVDCAPRLLNAYDRIVLKVFPASFGQSYLNALKKYRQRNTNKVYVSLQKFRENWINYLQRALLINARVIIISIALPDSSFLSKNPEANVNIYRYNDALFQLARKYDNISVTAALNPDNYDQPIYEDGYHPNQLGHQMIVETIKYSLQSLDE